MSNSAEGPGPGTAPSLGFLVGQGLLLLTLQVVSSRLLPGGLDPSLAAAPWLLLALAHGVWFKPRLPAPLHYVVAIVSGLGAAALELGIGGDTHAHGGAALVALALDVALYSSLTSALGIWIGRALRP